jgi:hypothetical protein
MTDKDSLIDYIFQHISLEKYKYNLIANNADTDQNTVEINTQLDFICKNNPYFGFNYYGYNNFLIFVKRNGNVYSFFIDRKTLKYRKKDVDIKNVTVTQIRLNVDEDLYKGTILDGILNVQNGKKTFIITDAFYVNGESKLDVEYKTKMEQLKTDVLPKIKTDADSDIIKFLIDNVYSRIEFFKLADFKTNSLKPSLNINARGMICYPTKSGIKYIWNTNKKKIVDSLPKIDINEDELNDTKEKSKPKTNDLVPTKEDAVMLMKTRDTPDVYDMYLRETKKKFKKIGLAYIPNTKSSKLFKSFFESESSDEESDEESDNDAPKEVTVLCKWQSKFKKWLPVKKSNKEVDFIDDIYSEDDECDMKVTGVKKPKSKSIKSSPEKIPSEKQAIMLMKIKNSDYDIYLRESEKKFKKIGIAYVPDTKSNKLFKSFFEPDESDSSDDSSSEKSSDDSDNEKTLKEVVVLCKWQLKSKQWLPIKKINKKIDFIEDIYSDD